MSYNKYHNQKSGGFDSKKERIRFAELQLMERAGKIQGLTRQVRFELLPNQYLGKKCIFRSRAYVADFTYWIDGEFVVEDCKGFRTDIYKLKKAMMYDKYKILIKET